LYKRQAIQWTTLDAQSLTNKSQPPGKIFIYLFHVCVGFFLVPMSRPVEQKAPSYPSSSQRAKNWDKIEAEIKKDEKDNKEDAGDANAYVVFSNVFN
jgi:hypothetical protein